MEILDKKSNRMSRANSGVFERSEFSWFAANSWFFIVKKFTQ